MADIYAYPNITDTAPIRDLLLYANTTTDGLFGIFTLISVFSISFLATKYYGTERSIAFASAITSVFGWFMFVSGVITSAYVPIVPTVVLFISFFFLK